MFLKVFVVIVALFFTTTGAFAEFSGPGAAASGANATIKEILSKPVNDMWVTLKGKILKKTGPEKYIFTDGTGEITVDIADGYFPFNRPVTPQTIMEISGEVNSDLMHLEVEIRQVVILGDVNPAAQQDKAKNK